MTLIDTDILIDVGKGVSHAVDLLQNIKSNSTSAISIVTQMELIVGCRDKAELREVDKFLRQFTIVASTKQLRISQLIYGFNSGCAVRFQKPTRLSVYTRFEFAAVSLIECSQTTSTRVIRLSAHHRRARGWAERTQTRQHIGQQI